MPSFHIHLKGRIQGVGFRPHVCRMAGGLRVSGTVSNGLDGVHVRFHSDRHTAERFLDRILRKAPRKAIVTSHAMSETQGEPVNGFQITKEREPVESDLLIPPDTAVCPDCINDIRERGNRRESYPFTTCLCCGPRYSIMRSLPYERENTSMSEIAICDSCASEYADVDDRRHHSQTNGCPECTIRMHWQEREGLRMSDDSEGILDRLTSLLNSGGIAAVKGTGGYLLLCDATNPAAVAELRRRKYRPFKPFAVMYPDLASSTQDVHIGECEANSLTGSIAPIVLCSLHDKENGPSLAAESIAPKLDKLGIMLPHTPLLQIIADRFKRPLVATSANLSGTPIIHRDADAAYSLRDMADAILSYDRDIVVPQDDSVWQFSEGGHRIILRRSRGMAPDMHPHRLGSSPETVLATGADLKAGFSLHRGERIYVSQYLGDLQDYRSQDAWTQTFDHLAGLLEARPDRVLADMHRGYHSHAEARGLARRFGASFHEYQHHECHFAAVLAENGLLEATEPLAGIVWDGTGFGSDGMMWGGETFLYEDGRIDRVSHLDYFPHLLGDKMSREPRLSAFSLLQHRPDRERLLHRHFSESEWDYYTKGLPQESRMLTSSMGRLIDGVAALIGLRTHNSYEAQAAMELEALARTVEMDIRLPYLIPSRNGRIDWRPMVDSIVGDLESGANPAMVARRFHLSLSRLVIDTTMQRQVSRIALSGGVFQNALLVDMVMREADGLVEVLLHKELSPNDECIAFGQLARHRIERSCPERMNETDPRETHKEEHVPGHSR